VSSSTTVPARPFHRPSSPTTTLKNSIVNAETKLGEKRTRLKKTKNDHKVIVSKVKKELDNYNNRLNSGNDENRQKQRSLQLERNIRQTEEATAVLGVQLDNMENIPGEELEEWSSQKAEAEHHWELLKSAKEDVAGTRMTATREIASLESELGSATQKRERLQSRRARVNDQYERIITANAQGLNERDRRAAEQFARDQARLEARFNEQLASISRSVQDYQMRTTQLWQQASATEQAIQRQQQQMLIETGPPAPEGNLPGINLQAENMGPAVTAMTITPANSRSILGMNALSSKPSPHQASDSLVATTTSFPTSPLPAPIQHYQGTYQVSSCVSSNSFGTDFHYRNRSSSNRSARSSLYAELEPMDSSRVASFSSDAYDPSAALRRRSSGSDGKTFTSPAYGPIGNLLLFSRAGAESRGSGSGSGSSSASPNSARGKVVNRS
jgi:ubiquitination network signaling protein AcrB